MPGKRAQLDDETWTAFRDLLAKHGRPVGLKAQLKRSAEKERARTEIASAKGEVLGDAKPVPSQ